MNTDESPFQHTPYERIITARSRRIRTTVLVLLMFVAGMALYGFVVLMPNLKQAAHSVEMRKVQVPRPPAGENTHLVTPIEQTYHRERKALAAYILFVYGYWSVCGALIIAIMIAAWLDFREVARSYSRERNALYMESASRLARNSSANDDVRR